MSDANETRVDATEPKPEPIEPASGDSASGARKPAPKKVEEIGGPDGPDPTRFGDWSVKGRCIDF